MWRTRGKKTKQRRRRKKEGKKIKQTNWAIDGGEKFLKKTTGKAHEGRNSHTKACQKEERIN